MAKEMVDFVKNQILVQASTAMLAQANQKSQSVMQLFQ
jgi:flagellin